jgi:hypothetical protein
MRTNAIRRVRRAAVALAVLAGASIGGLAAASPASAATCATRGHAYLTEPATRSYIFSGFEGDQSLGVPTRTITARQPSSLNTGGNGIRPGTSVTFNLWRTDGGTTFVRGIQTRTAGSNCVVNEQGARVLDYLDPGQYVVTANYFAGNTGQFISNEWVVQLVVPQPPPPPPPPPVRCTLLPPFGVICF